MATKKSSKQTGGLRRPVTLSVGQLSLFVGMFVFIGAAFVLKSFAATSPSNVGSITLNQAAPYLGSVVTFTTTYPKLPGGVAPRIEVMCYQDVNGDGVVTTTDPLAGNPDLVWATAITDPAYVKPSSKLGVETITLGGGSSLWLQRGGAATCVAKTFYFTYKGGQQYAHMLATTPFWAAGPAL